MPPRLLWQRRSCGWWTAARRGFPPPFRPESPVPFPAWPFPPEVISAIVISYTFLCAQVADLPKVSGEQPGIQRRTRPLVTSLGDSIPISGRTSAAICGDSESRALLESAIQRLRRRFLTAGEEPLEVFGAFLLVPLRTGLKESFADLSDASSFLSSDTFQVLLKSRLDSESKPSVLLHSPGILAPHR